MFCLCGWSMFLWYTVYSLACHFNYRFQGSEALTFLLDTDATEKAVAYYSLALNKWQLSFREPEGQGCRWIEALQGYGYSVQHWAADLHQNAHALSRRQCRHCAQLEEKEAQQTPDEQVSSAAVGVQPQLELSEGELQRLQGLEMEQRPAREAGLALMAQGKDQLPRPWAGSESGSTRAGVSATRRPSPRRTSWTALMPRSSSTRWWHCWSASLWTSWDTCPWSWWLSRSPRGARQLLFYLGESSAARWTLCSIGHCSSIPLNRLDRNTFSSFRTGWILLTLSPRSTFHWLTGSGYTYYLKF